MRKSRLENKSWSQIAREICDRVTYNVNVGAWSIKQAENFFLNIHYQAPLISERAAKRFGRLVKNGKVHEQDEIANTWYPYEILIK